MHLAKVEQMEDTLAYERHKPEQTLLSGQTGLN